MALRSIPNRRAAPLFRAAEAPRPARRPPPGIAGAFERERAGVEGWMEREQRHVARVVPAPRPLVIEPAPWLALRNWIVALAVVLIVLAFAWLAPRPTVTSNWSSSAIVGQAHAVEKVPYHGPAVITGEAAPE